MKEQIIERYGSIIKEEELWCRSEIGIINTCMLESVDPFPGYYGDVPGEIKPKFIYLVTKMPYSLEEIVRAFKNVKTTFPFIDIAISQISLFGETLPAIRIKNIDNYEDVKPLQEKFVEAGIRFDSKRMNVEKSQAIIKTSKFFHLREYTDSGIYMDLTHPSNGYFAIPAKLEWNDFKKIILHIKHNHRDYHFDAALGFFFSFSEIVDVVRIFTKNNDFDFIHHLKKVFLDRM